MDTDLGAEAAAAASPGDDPRLRESIAEMIERYAARLAAGPAIREYAHPINHNLYSADEAETIRIVLTALAQSVRAGLAEPESYWPHVARNVAA